jgi:hypothetical protein
VEAARSTETDERDESGLRTPKYHNADTHGRHMAAYDRTGRFAYPDRPNTADDSVAVLHQARYWRRTITDVHLPEDTNDD